MSANLRMTQCVWIPSLRTERTLWGTPSVTRKPRTASSTRPSCTSWTRDSSRDEQEVSKHSSSGLVSVRLVEAENLTDASSESQIKGKSCRIFELGLHLNNAMPTSLPTSVVNIQQYHETYISYLLSIDNPTNMQ